MNNVNEYLTVIFTTGIDRRMDSLVI